ncbi:MAG: hypothetical protein J5920_00900 [Candidatus Methanomethylophilaceae archaeon]|nr:hypothetical protein [Candidatus Methanomethylophilaceae archaeon]
MSKRPISAFDSTYIYPILRRILVRGQVKIDDLSDLGKYNTIIPRMDMLVDNGILSVMYRETGRACRMYSLTARGSNLTYALILSDSIMNGTLDTTDAETKELIKPIMGHTRYASYAK